MSKPKLYLFAIGGTGSRVLRSLTMLLSTGVHCNCEQVIPMIIDTDINNGDVEKCRNIIQVYNDINKAIYKGNSGDEVKDHFFRTKIMPPKELNISGTDYGTLREMLDYNSLSSKGYANTKGLFDLLYSNDNKDMPLEKGFLGNPNVGSVVLKNVVESTQFKEFTQDFKEGDRIFVVSSIFGGTGAAGFPLLLNVFRDESSGLNNKNYIKNSIIGGISVLPYFQVDVEKFNSGESAINSSTFITKSKAALSYYNRNLKRLVNALYYVGDTRHSNYENFDGGVEQKNPSNYIELTSAMAVLDFLDYEPNASTVSDLQEASKFFEYGIKEDRETLDFEHLKKDEFRERAINFHYYNIYISEFLESALKDDKLTWRNELGIPMNFDKQDFVKNLHVFAKRYYTWLHELSREKHGRRFLPFDLSIISNGDQLKQDPQGTIDPVINIEDKKLFTLVTGMPAQDSSNLFKKDRFKFDEVFSKMSGEISKKQLGSREAMLSFMLNEGIRKIIDKRFTLN